MFPSKYHQHGGFSSAMLVYQRVTQQKQKCLEFPAVAGKEISIN